MVQWVIGSIPHGGVSWWTHCSYYYLSFFELTFFFLVPGGPADKCGHLKVKDEIMKVNDIDFTEIRHYEAWNHLKFLPDGPVHLIIRRKP